MSHGKNRSREPYRMSGPVRMAGVFACGILIGIGIYHSVRSISRSGASSCVSSLEYIRSNLDCDISDKKQMQMSDLQTRLEAMVPVYQSTTSCMRTPVTSLPPFVSPGLFASSTA